MNPPSTELHPRPLLFRWAVAACLAVALLSRLSFLAQPFKNDAGIYINLGKVLWQSGQGGQGGQGGGPYVDFWDTKLPSVPLLMAPVWAAFGNHWIDYVLLQAMLGILGPALLARSVGRHVNPDAFAPALLMGLVGLNVSRLTLTGFQLETVQAFFECSAAAVVLWCLDNARGHGARLGGCFAAGLLVAAAAMPKPTGLAIGGAAGLALLQQRRSLRPVAAFSAGVLLPLIGIAIWVATQPWRSEMPALLREIKLYGSGTPWRSLLQPKTAVFFLLPFVPLLLRRGLSRGSTPLISTTPVRTFALAWMTLELLGVLLQRRLYGYHFLVLMSPATLCFALLPVRPRLWVTLISIAPLAAISLVFALPSYRTMRTDMQPLAASRYIAAHSTVSDTIWGDPAARLLLESDRRAGARLQMSFYLVNHDGAPQQFTDLLLSDFAARRPRFIVLPVDWWAEVQHVADDTPGLVYNPARRSQYLQQCHRLMNYITTHYQPAVTLDGKVIYLRSPLPKREGTPRQAHPFPVASRCPFLIPPPRARTLLLRVLNARSAVESADGSRFAAAMDCGRRTGCCTERQVTDGQRETCDGTVRSHPQRPPAAAEQPRRQDAGATLVVERTRQADRLRREPAGRQCRRAAGVHSRARRFRPGLQSRRFVGC